MYSFLQPVHSYLAYLVLATLIGVLVLAISALSSPANDQRLLKKVALFGMIFSHIQLLIGLSLYGISPYGFTNFSGEAMADAAQRLLLVEHPITNILAIILITLGYRKTKSSERATLAKSVLIYYGIGLVLLLSRIPWATWLD